MDSRDVAAFVSRVRERVMDRTDVFHGSLVWTAGGEGSDGSAIVLYQERPNGPVLGRRYDLDEFAGLFDPGLTVRDLADIAFLDDVADPTGSGTVRPEVGWADGFYVDAARVEWV